MRYIYLCVLLVGCAKTTHEPPPTVSDCGAQPIEAVRGDCSCVLTTVYDADCRPQVIPACPREAEIHEMSVRHYPQSAVMDLEVTWVDGSTCKSVLRLPLPGDLN